MYINQTYRMWKNLILVNKVLCLLSIAINSLNISTKVGMESNMPVVLLFIVFAFSFVRDMGA